MKMPMKRRGMNTIKTHAGTVGQTFLPHKAFMRISCLQMEKAHRLREMENSRRRIEAIKKRVEEIEAETNILLHRIKENTGTGTGTTTINKDKGLVLKY